MKIIKTKRLFIKTIITFLFLATAIILNYNSFENAKEACVNNNKTPKIEQDFIALNWSVSCE